MQDERAYHMKKLILIITLTGILLIAHKADSQNQYLGQFATPDTFLSTNGRMYPTSKISPLLERIAMCESNDNPLAKNPNSTASGRFQFLTSSWNHYGKELWGDELKNKDVFDYHENTELALYVFNKNGTRDWNASIDCWG